MKGLTVIMNQEERQRKILEYIESNGEASVKELSDAFEVSPVTIRADLQKLHDQEEIKKVHGGAYVNERRRNVEIPSRTKFMTNIKEKKIIGCLASSLIKSNDIVIFDSGSTTLEIAKMMPQNQVTNVTAFCNDLGVALELAHKPNVNLTVVGGDLMQNVYSLVGFETVDFFKKIKADKVFLGSDAVDFEFGLSNRTRFEIAIKLAMIEASDEVILVVDHSKLHKIVSSQICDLSRIDTLVIDYITEEEKAKMEEFGIKVISEEEPSL